MLMQYLFAVKGRAWWAGDDFTKELCGTQGLLELVTIRVHVQMDLNDQVDTMQHSTFDYLNMNFLEHEYQEKMHVQFLGSKP